MGEFAETSILNHLAEITIGLGANEVIRGNKDGVSCLRLRLSSVDNSQRRQRVDDQLGLYVLFSFRL
jgi:hypothetical protein